MTTPTPNFAVRGNFALSSPLSLAAKKEKFHSSPSAILRASESLATSFLQTLGVILLFVLLLQPLTPWLSRPTSQNHTWEKTFPSSTSHLEKTTCDYDAASGSSLYCNGDPVNGLDPDGRCVEGYNAGWANGNGSFAGTYDSSQASSQLAYGLGWTVGAALGDVNAVGAAVLTGINATIDFAEDVAHIPRGSLTAATFMFGPEVGGVLTGLRAWGTLRAGVDVKTIGGVEASAAVKVVGTELELSPWPANAGFIEGTVERKFLKPGETVDRFGFGGGKFVSPTGTPNKMRSLRPGTENLPYNNYKVLKSFEVDAGGIAPAFNQPGMGTQYELPVPIDVLIKRGVVEKIK